MRKETLACGPNNMDAYACDQPNERVMRYLFITTVIQLMSLSTLKVLYRAKSGQVETYISDQWLQLCYVQLRFDHMHNIIIATARGVARISEKGGLIIQSLSVHKHA